MMKSLMIRRPAGGLAGGLAGLLALLALSLAATSAAAQEWTRFRGPNGAGQSTADIPAQWSPTDFHWKVALPGSGHSSPVLWGDKIFVTSADPQAAKRYLLCLGAADGRELWRKEFSYEKYHINSQNSFATSTPAVDADHVYIAWGSPEKSTLYAFTHAGKEVWQRDLGAFASQHGFASSPIVYGDLVIIDVEQDGPNPGSGGDPDAVGYDGKSFVWAVDCKTGKVRWKTPRKSTIVAYDVPCVYRPTGGKPELIIDGRSHGMTALDPATGKVEWDLPLFNRRTVGSPIVVGGLVLGACGVGGGDNTLVAVRPAAREGSRKWFTKSADRRPLMSRLPWPPASWSFCGATGGSSPASTRPAANSTSANGSAAASPARPCAWGNKIFCLSVDGDMVVIAASDKYRLLAKNPLDETCRSTPAIAGGRMYVRTASHLISIGGK